MNKSLILIVEDKEEFRKIYGDRLRFGGYDVVDASDGNEALKILQSQPIDLVMTDINMPNKDGFGLVTDMKADDKLKNIPIVVMTVYDQTEHLKRMKELGVADYLVKGVTTPNDVLEKIKSLLQK